MALNIQPRGVYVDATFGRGGHAARILRALGPEGHLVLLDRDPEAIAVAQQLASHDQRVTVIHAAFSQLKEKLTQSHFSQVEGILFDFGVSSPQLDQEERGFSFRHNGPLDMRMDPSTGWSAKDWLATVSESELAQVIKVYGEERFHRKIARLIIQQRERKPIETTQELAELISQAIPSREKRQHPATRTFQAIRIEINRELAEIEAVLPQVVELLAPGGRLVTIAFHSLEDRIVKHFIKSLSTTPVLPRWVNLRDSDSTPKPALVALGKPIRPSASEVASNPRARSAIMRVAERSRDGDEAE